MVQVVYRLARVVAIVYPASSTPRLIYPLVNEYEEEKEKHNPSAPGIHLGTHSTIR